MKKQPVLSIKVFRWVVGALFLVLGNIPLDDGPSSRRRGR